MRAIRIATPPLAVLVAIGVALGLVLSSGGSKRGKCPHDVSAAQRTSGGSGCGDTAARAVDASGSVGGSAGGGQAPGGALAATATGGGRAAGPGAGGIATGIAGAVGASGSGGTQAGSGTLVTGSHGGQRAGRVTGTAGAGPGNARGGAGGTPVSGGTQPSAVAPGSYAAAHAAKPGTLASGQSETGTWSATSSIPTQMEPDLTAGTITFSPPLARYLNEEHVTFVSAAETAKPGASRSAAIRAACGTGGTLAAPTAEPGYLCVYTGVEDFRDRTPSGAVPTHQSQGAAVPFTDAEFVGIVNRHTSAGTNTTGARVGFGVIDIRTPEEEAKDAYPHIAVSGSWAVTAP